MNKNLEIPLPVRTLPIDSGRRIPRPFPSIKFLGGCIAFLIASLAFGTASQSVTLAWNANPETNIVAYVLRYGTSPGNPSRSVNVGNKTTATVSDLEDNKTYFFTVTARNSFGLESAPSNEVSYRTIPLGAHELTVINGTGGGSYTEGKRIEVRANPPAAGQQFDRWLGDYQILDNPLTPTTTALMLFRDLTIQATYSPLSPKDKIRYHPLAGYTTRMVGGVFEGTDGNPVTGTYTPLYKITTNPPPAWSEVTVNLGNFRYLRYRGPNGSYGTVAEIEFYRAGAKVVGTGYGTPGSWQNKGNTFEMALDGNPSTCFVGPTANGIYVGIDTGSNVGDKIRYYPLAGYSTRMVSGVFEGTNGNPVTGPYTPIYKITGNPPSAWSEVKVNLGNFRYLRYRGPAGSYGTVAEIEFYRGGSKVVGAGYGTPGSWQNKGNTFEKALDGSLGTSFVGPTPNGVFVGIDTASQPGSLLAQQK